MKISTIILIIFFISCLNAQTPVWDWVATAGGTSDVQLNAVIGDDNGNIYAVGYFEGSHFFGNEYVASQGGRDIFVAKMDSQGNWLWSTSGGGTSYTDEGNDIDITADNCLLITGVFEGTAFMGPDSLVSSGEGDIFVSKLDFDGNWLWSKKIGGSGWDTGNSVSVDNLNYAYITGSFADTIFYDTDTLVSRGNTDIIVAKLNPLRNWSWMKNAGGTSADAAFDLKVADDNRILLCGSYTGRAMWDSDTLVSDGYTDGFVAEMNDVGDFLWANRLGGNNFDEAYQIVPIDSGAIVSGHHTDLAFFDSIQITGNGDRDMFIAKVDFAGNWDWVAHGGSSQWDTARDIFVDSNNDIYATGVFSGAATMGSISFNGYGSRDVFVLKIDSFGNFQWGKEAGSSEWDVGSALFINNAGDVYIAGDYSSSAVFDNLWITSDGNRDCFVGKLRESTTAADYNETETGKGMMLCPNPFNPRTNISFELSRNLNVKLDVYNMKGQHVKSVVNQELRKGKHSVVWGGKDDSNRKVTSGVYFVRLQKDGEKAEIRKCVLLK